MKHFFRKRDYKKILKAVEESNLEQLDKLLSTKKQVLKEFDQDDELIFDAIRIGNFEIIELIMKHGISIPHRAISYNIYEDIELVKLLLSSGIRVSTKRKLNDLFNSTLKKELESENLEKISDLIANEDYINNTLSYFAKTDNTKSLLILIENGARVYEKLLVFPMQNNNVKMFKLLIDKVKYISNETIEYALSMDNKEYLNLLIPKCSAENVDVVFNAIASNNIESIKLLTRNKILINAKSDGAYKFPVLHEAIEKEKDEIVDILLDSGVNKESRDPFGRTPIIKATMFGKIDIVKKLIEAKVNINAKDEDSETALSIANLKGFEEIAELLRISGASKTKKDKKLYSLLSEKKALITVAEIGQYYNILLSYVMYQKKQKVSVDNLSKYIYLSCPKCGLEYMKNEFDIGYYSTIYSKGNVFGLTGMYGQCKIGNCPNPKCSSKQVNIQISF